MTDKDMRSERYEEREKIEKPCNLEAIGITKDMSQVWLDESMRCPLWWIKWWWIK
jgi:hypothetical protein